MTSSKLEDKFGNIVDYRNPHKTEDGCQADDTSCFCDFVVISFREYHQGDRSRHAVFNHQELAEFRAARKENPDGDPGDQRQSNDPEQ